MPYKYIKGREVLMDEHMLSATELAKIYGLFTLNNNPNGLLVTRILADYISNNNLNVSEYYYPHRQGVMRVYPSFIYEKALRDFVFRLEDGQKYVYIVDNKDEKRKINYKYKERQYGTVISIRERR